MVGVPSTSLQTTKTFLMHTPKAVSIFVYGIKDGAGNVLMTPAESRQFIMMNYDISLEELIRYVGSPEFRNEVNANAL